jgi:apolipoprotein N-acyltransferase|tara:strand:- start:1004 stop:1276 length:273 start_codon:yes stop_codon:yes gene_type:complete
MAIPELELPNSKKGKPMEETTNTKVSSNGKQRLRISMFVISCFAFTLVWIFLSMHFDKGLNAEWKELLLLLLGALIGNFNQVINYWFKDK